MKRAHRIGRLTAVSALGLLCAAGLGFAADDGNGGKGAKGTAKAATVPVDLSKLPPGLRKDLEKFLKESAAEKAPKSTPEKAPKPSAVDEDDEGISPFVEQLVAKGVRGTQLAEAIQKELTRRGMKDKNDGGASSGKPKGVDKGKGKDKDD